MAKKYKISRAKCIRCGGRISWDEYPEIKFSIHVDENGNKIGDGSCPLFQKQVIYSKSPEPYTRPTIKHKAKIDPNTIIPLVLIGSLLIILIPLAINSASNQGVEDYQGIPDIPDQPDTPDEPQIPSWEIDAQGSVTYIMDGDTHDVDSVGRIRLADIDCPDQGESGFQEAKDYLSSLIDDKHVYLDIDVKYGTDRYDRTVAVTYVRYNSTHLLNVNKDLLMQGFATIWIFDNEFNPYSWVLYAYYPL